MISDVRVDIQSIVYTQNSVGSCISILKVVLTMESR